MAIAIGKGNTLNAHGCPYRPGASGGRGGGRDARRPAHPARLGPLRRGIREVGLALITLGVIVLLFVAYQLWGTGIAEAHSQAALKRSFNAAVATHQPADSPDRGAIRRRAPSPSAAANPGAPRRMGPSTIWSSPGSGSTCTSSRASPTRTCDAGPVTIRRRSCRARIGNAAIAGHRTTYGAPFYSLNELRVGDSISLTDTAGRTFVYRVSEAPRVVSPSDVSVLDPTPFAAADPDHLQPPVLRHVPPGRGGPSQQPASAALRPPRRRHAPAPSDQAGTATVAAADTLGQRQPERLAVQPCCTAGLVVLLWIGARLLINRTRRWAGSAPSWSASACA